MLEPLLADVRKNGTLYLSARAYPCALVTDHSSMSVLLPINIIQDPFGLCNSDSLIQLSIF